MPSASTPRLQRQLLCRPGAGVQNVRPVPRQRQAPCFLLRTTKGLGVSYMENAVDWHGKAPNDEEYAQAMTELRAAHATLEKEIEFNNG